MYVNLELNDLEFLVEAIRNTNAGHRTALYLIPLVEKEQIRRCRQAIKDLLRQRKRKKEWLDKLLKDGINNKDQYQKHYEYMRNPKRITELRIELLRRKKERVKR